MSAQLWQALTWDVARVGGLIGYLLLTLAVVLGLALSRRWQRPRWPRLITNERHSYDDESIIRHPRDGRASPCEG